jgi:hypothetical protein
MSSFSKANFDAGAAGVLVNDTRKIPCIAAEALTAGQVVEISADFTVKASSLTTTPSNKVMGVCLTSAAANAPVTVITFGWIVRAKAYGQVNAGDTVSAGPYGTVQTIAQPTASDCNTSAGTAAAISKMVGAVGYCWVGAASGGSALIMLF